MQNHPKSESILKCLCKVLQHKDRKQTFPVANLENLERGGRKKKIGERATSFHTHNTGTSVGSSSLHNATGKTVSLIFFFQKSENKYVSFFHPHRMYPLRQRFVSDEGEPLYSTHFIYFTVYFSRIYKCNFKGTLVVPSREQSVPGAAIKNGN